VEVVESRCKSLKCRRELYEAAGATISSRMSNDSILDPIVDDRAVSGAGKGTLGGGEN
jgi:hypothetical protein